MKLTIGMAVYDDYDGAYFTIQALRMYHDLRSCELLVVDNSPDTPAGQAVRQLIEPWLQNQPDIAAARYIPMPDVVGTTQTRQRIFDEARGDSVLCVDSHVLIRPGAIERLIRWYDEHPDFEGLVHGPLLFDDLHNIATHFDDQWRAEMWGTWGLAWQCGCGPEGVRFSTGESSAGKTQYYLLSPGRTAISACGACDRELPQDLPWPAHERALDAAGYVRLGVADDGEPFDIPGQGLGLFTCRREAWLRFNPHFRGFGGEEMYIHTKYRQAGRRVLCLPFLKWLHRFGRPGGVKYPLNRWNKVRNYVLGHAELGLPLDPVFEHFVGGNLMPREEWDYLVADPVQHVTIQTTAAGCGGCGTGVQRPQPPDGATLEDVFAWCQQTPRDLDQHLSKVRELVEQVESVTAMVKRREWDVAVLAGRPKEYVTFNTEPDPLTARLHELVKSEGKTPGKRQIERFSSSAFDSLQVEQIMSTDLLIVDTVHHAERLWTELSRFAGQVRRWILLRGTGAFGEIAEGGQGPGLLPALRRWMREHPEWSVIYHTQEQYGLTLISRDARDKPSLPGKITMAANLAKAMAAHVADGMHMASHDELEARLSTCSLCDHRRDDRCSMCGCFLAPKAALRSSECPLGRWPAVIDPAPAKEAA